jgi:hypothetical protein
MPKISRSLRLQLLVAYPTKMVAALFVSFAVMYLLPVCKFHESAVMADDGQVYFRDQLSRRLRASTEITLMMLPGKVLSLIRMDEEMFRKIACFYQIRSDGPSYDAIFDIFDRNIVAVETGRTFRDVQMGIVFKNGEKVLQEFYFEDWEGQHEVRGVSSEYSILVLPETPIRLRDLLTRKDVVLIKNSPVACPHS